jgi:hypothetical protein
MKTKAYAVTRGSGNIFADLGLPNADEHMLKARIVIFIGKRIEQLELIPTLTMSDRRLPNRVLRWT